MSPVLRVSFYSMLLLALVASACGKSGPVLADKLGTVARIRIDRMSESHERQQFFVADPKDVADLLKALGTTQHLHAAARFEGHTYPKLGLTFFDTSGMPRAVLNFSADAAGPNELYATNETADYLGAVIVADAAQVAKIIARAAPAAP